MKLLTSYSLFVLLILTSFLGSARQQPGFGLRVSANHRYFTEKQGRPFFWLGDTGWLLFSKLNREEAEVYLENRRIQGFNVIQAMVLHSLDVMNCYGDSALVKSNVAVPRFNNGKDPLVRSEYDYWDHVDYIVKLAARKGLYIAMVPVWGGNVKKGQVTSIQAAAYAKYLALRYRSNPNIIWMNGGDIKGSDSTRVWNTIGSTLAKYDKNHLITFHPFGRTQSATWFHNESWLSFNTFQSGHRDYSQDTVKGDKNFGEDNWRYVREDYLRRPVKPTLDAEPSYEGIPHGLHDTLLARWMAKDLRRYAYWSVFAGAAGFTYGNNSVMQMLQPGEKNSAYGAKEPWINAISDPGAGQMKWLKKLVLSRPYMERVPDQSLLLDNTGQKYDRVLATRGKNYAFIYSFTSQPFRLQLGKLTGTKINASWYDPRTGKTRYLETFANKGTKTIRPPGETADGADWVLILDGTEKS